MRRVDFKKDLSPLYRAGKKVREVTVEAGMFLAVEGVGQPGGESFDEAIQQLYSVAYTLKFTLKQASVLDFTVCSVEGI